MQGRQALATVSTALSSPISLQDHCPLPLVALAQVTAITPNSSRMGPVQGDSGKKRNRELPCEFHFKMSEQADLPPTLRSLVEIGAFCRKVTLLSSRETYTPNKICIFKLLSSPANLLKCNIYGNQKYTAQLVFTKLSHLPNPDPQKLNFTVTETALWLLFLVLTSPSPKGYPLSALQQTYLHCLKPHTNGFFFCSTG